MKNENEVPFSNIEPFLNAVILASNRSRSVVLILSTASILAFVGFWNSKPDNWISARVNFASNNVEYLKSRKVLKEKETLLKQLEEKCLSSRQVIPTPTPTIPKSNNRKIVQNNQAANTSLASNSTNLNNQPTPCQELHSVNNEVSVEKERIIASRFTTSKAFYDSKEKELGMFLTSDNFLLSTEITKAEEDLRIMARIRRENSTIFKVPFFGTSFDVNDLSMVSGLTFIIILIWLRLSLWTELNSTYQVFERVKKEDLVDCYEYLSMHLVFTIPKAIDSELKRFGQKQWKWVVLLIIILPLAIQLLVLVNDLVTVNIGSYVSLRNTIVVLISGFTTFVVTALLTVSCLSLASSINKLWLEQGAKINNLKKTRKSTANNTNDSNT
ncbi:MAG TPA: hypothetical protein PKY59_01205 [Pyrinomonadaceae bacterium]|nr:hypothetical protein [Pyrinomonadaceae bacterium]